MKTAGVIIDDWKLPIFKKHLDGAGYAYTKHSGAIKGTLTLRVQYEWATLLRPIIAAADKECANVKQSKGE